MTPAHVTPAHGLRLIPEYVGILIANEDETRLAVLKIGKRGSLVRHASQLGAACDYEVCQVVGAHIPEEGWERIRSGMRS